MATKDVAALLVREFVIVKLDLDRGIGAKEIERRLISAEPGLPWFAIPNTDSKCLTHSARPNGRTIGHPFQSDDVAFFRTMLQTVKKHFTDQDINFLIQSLEAFNNKTVGLQPTNSH
jgi:hypothetical protein